MSQGHRFPHLVDEAYRVWIRERPCAVPSFATRWPPGEAPCQWLGLSEPDHARTRGAAGADRQNLVPLCRPHHQARHRGVRSFESRYGFSLRVAAEVYDEEYRAERARHEADGMIWLEHLQRHQPAMAEGEVTAGYSVPSPILPLAGQRFVRNWTEGPPCPVTAEGAHEWGPAERGGTWSYRETCARCGLVRETDSSD